ncbi:MAG: cobaltochelatase subunit CobN, partial [Alphaproteobacteria bacterium]
MHLLALQGGVIGDGTQAVDLCQDPADIVFISAADSELAALARARDTLDFGPSLRLANQMALSHNMSVDLYVDKVVAHARLVILRLLGGASYWAYGLEQVAECVARSGAALAVLPGDAQPDPELSARSTLPAETVALLHGYLREGGPENLQNMLRACAHLLGEAESPPAPVPLLKAGLYWPGRGISEFEAVSAAWRRTAPCGAIIFYRALIEGANTGPVDALVEALEGQGLNPLPVFISSLKEEVSAATLRALFERATPQVILNATGFAVSAGANAGSVNPLAEPDCPVLQLVFSGSSREEWAAGQQGLNARDLAMNVVLPELDGRVLARAVSFKRPAERHAATQCEIVTYAAEPDRVDFCARLAARWARLARIPNAEKRVAIILANYPNRDARIGNGVGYDTPASTLAILQALKQQGYDTGALPRDAAALIAALKAGPTNAPGTKRRAADAQLSLAAYRKAFAQLPESVRAQVRERWGAPENDPFVREGAFHLALKRFGNVVVGIQPARGYNIDPRETYHDPALVPPHGYLAFYMWLRDAFGAQALIHNGKHGNLEWLPGKALALSAQCYPEAVLGPLPNIYPFIVNDPGEGTQAKRRTAAVIIDHLTPPLTRAESYGPLKDLEALIDEYFLASGLDERRLALLRERILDLAHVTGLDSDAGIAAGEADEAALQKIDTYICELKEAQIRDGLHILGSLPSGAQERDLLVALTRAPRGMGEKGDASLIRAIRA